MNIRVLGNQLLACHIFLYLDSIYKKAFVRSIKIHRMFRNKIHSFILLSMYIATYEPTTVKGVGDIL